MLCHFRLLAGVVLLLKAPRGARAQGRPFGPSGRAKEALRAPSACLGTTHRNREEREGKQVLGLGFEVLGPGVAVLVLGFKVLALGFEVLGFGAKGLRLRVFGLRVRDS